MNDIAERLRQGVDPENIRETESAMDEAAAEIARLQELLKGLGGQRYWQGRWRDEEAENARLRAVAQALMDAITRARCEPTPELSAAYEDARRALEGGK
jgi:hypothetical protein